MSPPLLGAEGEGQSNASLVASHCILQNGSGLKEHNYLNLSDCSSVDSSPVLSLLDENKINLNLKATELGVGLPGSQSPEREPELCLRSSVKLDEKPLFPLLPSKDGICSLSQKTVVSGNKRGFSDSMDGISKMKSFVSIEEKWMFHADSESPQSVGQGKFPGNSGINVISSPRPSGTQPSIVKEVPQKALQERPRATDVTSHNQMSASNNNSSVPAAEAQVVGWPPLRTFRKNTLAISSKNNVEVDGNQGPGYLFVKVSLDSAPFQMSPPLLGAEGEGQSNASLVASHCILQNGSGLEEQNYLNLSDCSSVDSSPVLSLLDENKINLNLKATELRLGLPGSQSPERELELCLRSSVKLDEKLLFPLLPSKDGICSLSQKTVVSGNKRGFSDTMDGISGMKIFMFTEGKWMFHADSESPQSVGQGKFPGNLGINVMSSPRPSGTQPSIMKEVPPKALQERPRATDVTSHNQMSASNNNSSVPAARAQIVGWPPLRTFRKSTLATSSKNNVEVDGKQGPGALFVKVSLDGAPFLRKVDFRNYTAYQELSSALEKMFSCFTIGQCGSHGAPGREMLSESKLRDLLHGSEYVLTYEDKDGDWMLVGDVPWEMFLASCKRLKIMKSSDAIGLAPRAVEKSKNRN